MILEDIIDILNSYIENKRIKYNIPLNSGDLILHKTIVTSPIAKAYKVYEYTLWYVKPNVKYKVLTMKKQDRIISGKEEEFSKIYDKLFLEDLFNLIINTSSNNSVLEDIIYGRYTDNGEFPDKNE